MCEAALSDEELAEKFRREFHEQFLVLVRMHLSFVLDLQTDDNESLADKGGKLRKWSLVPFSKKFKAKGLTEGTPLTQEGICQVYQLIEFLKKEQNIVAEGIFRRTGSLARQQELRSLLNQGVTIELENSPFSIHDCASVLKGFLAELPDPLLTEAHYPVYCQIAELCGAMDGPTRDEKLLVSLQLLLMLLPSENKALLRDILDLLHLTASHEPSNRMSPDNLATLFTPHLLCPRKLSPEQLHVNSQNLCVIVSFMIAHARRLFDVPHKLLVDFRAKFERRKLLANRCLNESVGDQFAASTVFTFVDQERTARENENNTTETALAQLYAHIQTMPDSSKKRKLVKQFNKENGHGTPLQVIRAVGPKSGPRSLGDSIKKHIFHKSLMNKVKKSGLAQTPPSLQGVMNRARLFCANNTGDDSDDVSSGSDESSSAKRTKTSSVSSSSTTTRATVRTASSQDLTTEGGIRTPCDLEDVISGGGGAVARRVRSEPDLSVRKSSYLLTSTPALNCERLATPHHAGPDLNNFTPEGQDRKSMSPITRSTQRMTRAMQETMMTPRSRKPVLLISQTNISTLTTPEELPEESSSPPDDGASPPFDCDGEEEEDEVSLTETFRQYLSNRSMLTITEDSSFSSRTDDFNSNDFNDVSDKLTDSMLHCLDGNDPEDREEEGEKKPVLKPKQFDENGHPIVFETSF